ncbi:altronate hydrolase [Pseudoxanthobacter soli DSM 19599]|uniref:Altronate hydrolase n=1 Tax=Pseudoxanthobacter soli DSM 19599 TaxID=1123029 RepID=A0A1M7Z884_9HYPH|nr:UxaA family hydrolase [Pseudoxanthobacter soli]SHO61163.1 altronate hydrolase [Pseudoxanthobacter soli DSM 19599]
MSEGIAAFDTTGMRGYPRADGRHGIRNYLLVAYLVECAHHVARAVAAPYQEAGVQLIGFPGCYPSDYAQRMMEDLSTHPNVGAVLLVSLGCEEFQRARLRDAIAASGRPVELITIQACGGTRATVARGREWIEATLPGLRAAPTEPIGLGNLVVGTKCGGSDGLSGVTINPAVGNASDRLVDAGATVMFEETCELLGCEEHMAARAVTVDLADALRQAVRKADVYYRALGHGSFGGGNIKYGLSTLEEKSLGAYAKSGSRPISGLLKPGDRPTAPGLYLMDTVNDGPVRYGIPNINDTQTITEMVASGCHLILFTTGAGSVVGQAVAPVIKGVSNSRVFRRMEDDMDVNGGTIADGVESVADVGRRLVEAVIAAASGTPTRSEALGHQEFVLSYKTYEPLGPACLAG